MQVEEQNAAGASDYKGETYYFCGQGCKQKFDENPEACANKARRAET
jgi:Cu+-exporting ATPase